VQVQACLLGCSKLFIEGNEEHRMSLSSTKQERNEVVVQKQRKEREEIIIIIDEKRGQVLLFLSLLSFHAFVPESILFPYPTHCFGWR